MSTAREKAPVDDAQKARMDPTSDAGEGCGSVDNGDDQHQASLFFSSLLGEYVFLMVVCSSQLFAQACLAQGLVPARYIAFSFSTQDESSAAQISWFTASYSLTFGTFIILSGYLGDRFGHRRCFIAGFLWLSLWSLVAGLSTFAKSIVLFDFCRAQQGLGSALLLPNSLAILGTVYPAGPRKNMAFAIYGAAAPSGFFLGALFSALLAQFATWPWIYWMGAIATFILALLARIAIPALPKTTAANSATSKSSSPSHSHTSLITQATTSVAALVLFNVVWNQAPVVGWSEPIVILLLVLAAVFAAVFIWISKRSTHRIIPVELVKGRTAIVLIIIALGWGSFGIVILYFFQFLEVVRHATPLSAVAQIVPALVSGPLAAVTAGVLLNKVSHAFILVPALLAFCAGNIIAATLPVTQSFWLQAFWLMVVVPWGMDMSFPAATVLLSNSVSQEYQGIAASLVTTTVNYSISIGLGIAGTVISNIDADNPLDSFRAAWYVGIGLSSSGVLLALCFAIENAWRSRNNRRVMEHQA